MFDIDFLCQDSAQKFYKSIRESKNKRKQKSKASDNKNKKENVDRPPKTAKKSGNRNVGLEAQSTHANTTPSVTKKNSATTQ